MVAIGFFGVLTIAAAVCIGNVAAWVLREFYRELNDASHRLGEWLRRGG